VSGVDYYDRLGVPRSASAAEVDEAFLREAAGADAERVRDLEIARGVLTDPERRARYDEWLATAPPATGPAAATPAAPSRAQPAEATGSTALALAAALVAALAGAVVWALVVRLTDYEVGVLAWGIGFAAAGAARAAVGGE
jgi:hypothetical protein